IYPRLIANEHDTTVEPDVLTSGVPQLDKLLGGGVDRGSSTLFMGPAGAGKSTLALQYAITAAEKGEKSIIFAFDEG
ncbi:MAG: ATPase domain-containing protein, partial [Bdellovibrionota bacterium]